MRLRWMAFLLVWMPAAAGAAEQGLFSPDWEAADQATMARNGVVRARAVTVDLGLLPGSDGKGPLPPSGHAVLLNLFDDVVVHARMIRSARLDNGLSWVGRIESEAIGDVVLTVLDGVLTGSAVWPSGAYRIVSHGGAHVVEQIEASQFPEGNCFREVAPRAVEPLPDPPVMADDGSFIDVLVVYTTRARTQSGGTSSIVSLINTAVAETNAGYANSGVIQRLRLVGTQEVPYTEAGTTASAMSTDLSNLAGGSVSGVLALRESTKADLVSMIVDGYNVPGGACGIAYLMAGNDPAFAGNAFSVADRSCATGYYSFGHEIGHNMGLNHAREDPTGTGAFPYSYGYKDPGNAFRTVMAYNCTVNCARVLHFSNPSVSYGGRPTGVNEVQPTSANNALSLNNSRMTVANWRVSGGPVEKDATGDQKADVLLHESGGTLTVRASTGSAFSATGTWASGLSQALHDVYFADVTGDQMADAVARNRSSGDVTVYASTGSSFSLLPGPGPGGVWSYGWSSGYDLYFADVTGDGKADLVSRYYGPTAGLTGDVYIAVSSGTGFASPLRWTYGYSAGYDLYFADVSGDGRADLAARYYGPTTGLTGDVYVGLSTGSGFSSPARWTYGYSAGYDLYFADATGDGLADLVSRYYGPNATLTGDVNVMASTGTSLRWVGSGARWTYGWGSTYELVFRDVTGDGRADMVGRATGSGELFVASSTGTSFSYLGAWASGVGGTSRVH